MRLYTAWNLVLLLWSDKNGTWYCTVRYLLLVTVGTGWLVWSDDGEDDYFEDGDLFSRLEEIRAQLENELGLDVLKRAYEAVQVVSEDRFVDYILTVCHPSSCNVQICAWRWRFVG